jgi:polyhydroxybutyrate depolymerase
MKRLLPLLALTACPTAPHFPEIAPDSPCVAGAIQPGEQVLRVEVGGKVRQALVWMPVVDGPHSIVMNLHSFRSEPRRVAHYMGLVEWAKDKPVIVIGADGKTATWNAGECCGKAMERDYPDVEFLDALVAQVESIACTTGEVTASGLGNGAFMAHRWACESEVPDALITAGGTLQAETCSRTRPLPILHYHGTEDGYAPADGSMGHRPVEYGLALWRGINGVTQEATVTADGELSCQAWTGAAPVTYCTIEGGFHGWPGSQDMPVSTDMTLGQATPSGYDWLDTAKAAMATQSANDDAVEPGLTPNPAGTVENALEASVDGEEGAD